MSISALIDDHSSADFYKTVYLIQKQLALGDEQYNKVGHDSLPDNELIRFKAIQHLGFPGHPISNISKSTKKNKKYCNVDMSLSFMGLTGPSGVLPQHYSELVLQRVKLKDTGMRDFYDLFNHRIFSLFYRAWEKYQFGINLQTNDRFQLDPFTQSLSHLAGGKSAQNLYYSGIFNHKIRSVEGLQNILTDITNCDVLIEQFQGKWMYLDASEQTRLGSRVEPEGHHARLGMGASCGSRVWDINSNIKIVLTPKSNTDTKSLLPNGKRSEAAHTIIKAYLTQNIDYTLQLKLQHSEVTKAKLSHESLPLGLGCQLIGRSGVQSSPCILSLN